jgi:gliding motility-associated-like protein
VCRYETVVITATVTGSYDSLVWSPTPYALSGNQATYVANTLIQVTLAGYSGGAVIASDTANIFLMADARFFPTPNPVCEDAPVLIGYTGTTPSISHQWFFVGGNPSTGTGTGPFNVVWNQGGDFPVKLISTSGSCVDSFIDTIHVIERPDPTFFAFPNPGCQSDTVTFTYTGMDPFTLVRWNFQGGNPTNVTGVGPHKVVWNTPGNHQVKVTAYFNTCVDTLLDTIVILPKPIVDAGPDLAICQGDTVTLLPTVVGNNCTYQWQPFQELDNPFSLNPRASPDSTTTYYLKAICDGCKGNVDSMVVYVYPRPYVEVDTPQNGFCAGSGGVQLQATAQGGRPNYTWIWSPSIGLSSISIPNPIANPPVDTTYYVTVVDANGCQSNTDSVFVRIYPLPIVDAGPDVYLCEKGPGVFLNPTILNPQPGGYQFEWHPGTGLSDSTVQSPYARPDSTTLYYVIATHELSGCSSDPTTLDSISYVAVFVNPTPIAEAGPDSVFICLGESIQIGGLPSGAGPTYQFEWTPTTGLSSPGANFPWAQPIQTTTYQLVVISNGCRSEPDYITVVVRPRPTVATSGVLGPVCPGDSVQLWATVSSNAIPPIQYYWSPTTGLSNPNIPNPKAAPGSTTWYTVHVTSQNCVSPVKDSTLVQVHSTPIPIANTTGTTLRICEGDSIRLPATIQNPNNLNPITYYWKANQGIWDTLSLTPYVSPMQTTTYTLVVEYGGCIRMDSTTVFVDPSVELTILASDTFLCVGDTLYITLISDKPNPIYSWIASGNLQFPNAPDSSFAYEVVTDTTRYIVQVYEGKCSDVDTFDVYVSLKPRARFLYNTEAGCDSLLVSFLNLSDSMDWYSWDFGDGSPPSNDLHPQHVYQNPGFYTVRLIVQAAGGCTDTATTLIPVTVNSGPRAYYVSQPADTTIIYLPTPVQFFDSSSGGIQNWFWEFGDGNSSTEPNPIIVFERPGILRITLTVVDSFGCTSQFSRIYHIVAPTAIVPNVFTPNGDGVNDAFRLVELTPDFQQIQVFDRFGVLVFESSDPDFQWDGTDRKGRKLPVGTYFYIAKIGEKVIKGQVTLLY